MSHERDDLRRKVSSQSTLIDFLADVVEELAAERPCESRDGGVRCQRTVGHRGKHIHVKDRYLRVWE